METKIPDLDYKRELEHREAADILTDLINRLGHLLLDGEIEMLFAMRGLQALLAEKIKQTTRADGIPNQMMDEAITHINEIT